MDGTYKKLKFIQYFFCCRHPCSAGKKLNKITKESVHQLGGGIGIGSGFPAPKQPPQQACRFNKDADWYKGGENLIREGKTENPRVGTQNHVSHIFGR